jgi:fatty-acyl-CoA synthase
MSATERQLATTSPARAVSTPALADYATQRRERHKARGEPSDLEKLRLLRRFVRTGLSTGLNLRWIDFRHVRFGGGYSLGMIVDENAALYPNQVAIADVASGRKFTFAEVARESRRVAQWARNSVGLARGDRCSLFMENGAEFLFAWLGMSLAGVTTAFTNYKLHGRQLRHVLTIAEAKVHVVSPALVAKFRGVIKPEKPGEEPLVSNHEVFVFGPEPEPSPESSESSESGGERDAAASPFQRLARVLAALPELADMDASLRKWRQGQLLDDTLWLIYTSGTTGMPKASMVTTRNVLARIYVLGGLVGMTPEDRLFCALPLYHSTGSLLCLAAWRMGGGIIVARSFSPGTFWSDCDRFGATGIVYVGEVCRYLLQHYNTLRDSSASDFASDSAPDSGGVGVGVDPRQCNGSRQVRFAVGNGLRPDVWPRFLRAFSIAQVVEFYGSTEGSGLINISGRVGAVGYYPWPVSRVVMGSNTLAKFDVAADDLVRGSDGFAVECAPGEAGELLSRIPDEMNNKNGKFGSGSSSSSHQASTSGGTFAGYTDAAATEKKILRGVFEAGDAWFRTGDLLRIDEYGFLFFVDRVGDTFRWKGENVSTAEVAEVVGTFRGVRECCVFGVEAPPREGRAGMAAIALGDPIPQEDGEDGKEEEKLDGGDGGLSSSLADAAAAFDWPGLFAHLGENLAAFARPVFIRVVKEVPKTATFKFKKNDLQKDGFDPKSCAGSILLIRDQQRKTYTPLTTDVYASIVDGRAKL